MSAIQDVPSKAAYNRLFGVLTDDTRRRIVRILRRRTGPLSEAVLAERLADENAGGAGSESADRLRVRLRHVHLPKLAASGLVAWDEEGATVSIAAQPGIGSDGLDALMTVEDDRGSIAAALADEQRRAIVEVMAGEDGPVDRTALARRVATEDADGEPSSTSVRDVEMQLHHRHLPRLEEAGLVEYDAEGGLVTDVASTTLSTLLPTSQ